MSAAFLFAPFFGIVAHAAVVHYPPASSTINNFTFSLDGSGSPGIFSSSATPDKLYGEYNWCNMPHVRDREYKTPSKDFVLQYVEVIQRHHKRTPYGSNTFFKEDVTWNCVGEGVLSGLKTSRGPGSDAADIQWQASTNPFNPWTTTVGPGFVGSTCQFPQITGEGLGDAITHGTDLRGVYAKRLGLGSRFDPSTSQIRVTNNVITSQVASGLVKGLFPQSTGIEVFVQAPAFDSLEPTYPCNKANSLKTTITTGNANWTNHLSASADLYAKLDSISGIATQDTGGWHVSFDHYYDNMSAKQCHAKTLPCNLNDTSSCVTQDMANTVYRLGNWEYSHQYRDAPESAQYSALKYGAWMLELKGHLQAKMNKSSKLKYVHNIGHDGSVSPLLGFLQISNMVWPGMGAEVVFELYEKSKQRDSEFFIRVLWGGQPMETSTPLGVLDMVPINNFFAYIDSMVGSGSELLAACNSN
ncbi:histidine phosphatase [Collybia nuda]|uniref:Histidine phosphatase n=1 Tax=Collybia nuda TaxID=64659 RepID=A0A9P5YBB8_9AGAR|nr:histidine phosphatase [Collybia nuda]